MVARADATVMGVNPFYFSPEGAGKDALAGLPTDRSPVEMVSWNDAAEFCANLSDNEGLKPCYARTEEAVTPLEGDGHELPSEACWEFACRAGAETCFSSGDRPEDLLRVGWWLANSGRRTHSVGDLPANSFGLHDLHGNVNEWCLDSWEPGYYEQFLSKPAIDPLGPPSAGRYRVVRGGGWGNLDVDSHSARRWSLEPTTRHIGFGFRVILPVKAVRQPRK